MRCAALTGCLVALLSACSTTRDAHSPVPPPQTRSFVETIADFKRSIVPIVCVNVENNTPRILSVEGTGFFISADGTFITAEYILASTTAARRTNTPCPATAFYLPQNGQWPVEAPSALNDFYMFDVGQCRRDQDLNLAICKSSRAAPAAHPIRPVTFAETRAPEGLPIAASGFSRQYSQSSVASSSVGHVQGYALARDDGKGPREMLLDVPIWLGEVGGPVFDVEGRVVGLLHQLPLDIGYRSRAVPGALIRAFIAAK